MKTWIKIAIPVAAVAAVVAWYAFRPERLFIDQKVSEAFPAAQAQAASGRDGAPKVLATGRFHSVAHQSGGTATIHVSRSRARDGRRYSPTAAPTPSQHATSGSASRR